MARMLLFAHWLLETKSFSMAYDEETREFKYESPRAERIRERQRKIKKLMDIRPVSSWFFLLRLLPVKFIVRILSVEQDNDALTKAYRASGSLDARRQRDRRGKSGRGSERRRRGRNDRSQGSRNKDWASVVFIVVDLPAVLLHLKNVQKLANKRRFVVVFPRPGNNSYVTSLIFSC